MIAIDLCQANYQILLIACLEFLIKNAYHAKKEKKNNQSVILLGLKITDWVTNAKNVKKHESQQMKQLKNFPDLYWFYNGDLDNFLLLLGKGVYPYECMNSWGKFDETSIPPEKAFSSELNEEGISDADYACVEKVWEIFKIKNLGKYHDLYAQCGTLLLADVFENFRDKCD